MITRLRYAAEVAARIGLGARLRAAQGNKHLCLPCTACPPSGRLTRAASLLVALCYSLVSAAALFLVSLLVHCLCCTLLWRSILRSHLSGNNSDSSRNNSSKSSSDDDASGSSSDCGGRDSYSGSVSISGDSAVALAAEAMTPAVLAAAAAPPTTTVALRRYVGPSGATAAVAAAPTRAGGDAAAAERLI